MIVIDLLMVCILSCIICCVESSLLVTLLIVVFIMIDESLCNSQYAFPRTLLRLATVVNIVFKSLLRNCFGHLVLTS